MKHIEISDRTITFNQRIFNYQISLPRPDDGGYVFEQRWWNRREFVKAVNTAGLGDFTFHVKGIVHSIISDLQGMTVTLSKKHPVIKLTVLSNVTFLSLKMK